MSRTDVRNAAIEALGKDWDRGRAAQVLDYLDERPDDKAAVVAYLSLPDHRERDALIADIRRRLPLVKIAHADLAEKIGDALDKLEAEE